MCRLIAYLLEVSRSCGCYKVILDCSDQNVPFYEKLGFKKNVNHMANYFEAIGGAAQQQSSEAQTYTRRKQSNG